MLFVQNSWAKWPKTIKKKTKCEFRKFVNINLSSFLRDNPVEKKGDQILIMIF